MVFVLLILISTVCNHTASRARHLRNPSVSVPAYITIAPIRKAHSSATARGIRLAVVRPAALGGGASLTPGGALMAFGGVAPIPLPGEGGVESLGEGGPYAPGEGGL